MVRSRGFCSSLGLGLIVIEHEQPNGRGQIAVLALGINRADEVRQGHAPVDGDLLQSPPERLLKTDTGLVSGNDDGAFDDL